MKHYVIINRPNHTANRGFTLIEMLVAIVASSILILCVGTLLASSQQQFNRINNRVNGSIATDGLAAQRTFDAICRKSSWRKCELDISGSDLTLYYYRTGSSSSIPEKYARFHLIGEQLVVDNGDLKSGQWIPDTSSTPARMVLADQVENVQFTVQDQSISMVLTFDSAAKVQPITCASVRNNQ